MLFSEAVHRMLEHMSSIDRSPRTLELYERDLGTIRIYLEKQKNGPVYIEDVSVEDLEAFMRYTKEVKNYAPNTRGKYFYALRSLYAFAYKKGIVDRNIALAMDFIKMPRKERQYLEIEEVEALVEAMENPLIRLVTIFLFNTGLRISECMDLTLEDVNLEKRIIHVREGKGGKDRIVPINNNLYELLKDYKENWRDAYGSKHFFATKRTGRISYSHTNATIRETAKKVGIKKQVSCHTLRHSFASALVKKNVGLVEISKLLGHESLAVTSIYTHTNLSALNNAVNAL